MDLTAKSWGDPSRQPSFSHSVPMRAFSTSVISGLQHLLENLARGGLTCSGRRPGIPQTCRTARPEVRSRTQRRGRPSGISAGESSTSSNPMNVSKWGLRPPARVSCRTGLQGLRGYGVTGLRGYERSPCELHKHRARHLPRSLSLSPCDSVPWNGSTKTQGPPSSE